MKTKAANIFSSIKYELCIFLLLAIQAVFTISPFFFYVGEHTRLYYLIDFSMGKTSRLLVGSIVKLLNADPSPEWIGGFATVVLALVLLMSSIVIGKVIRSVGNEYKPQVLVLTAFLITGLFTFSGFSEFLGVLDIWMFIAALLAVVCAFNKYLRWFIPVLCVAGVLVHNAFAITYFPFIILVVLYLAASEEKKGVNITVFVLSCIATVALTLFVTMKSTDAVTVNQQQIYEALKHRGGYTYDDHGIGYILFYLLDIPPEYTGYTAEMVAQASIFERFVMMMKFNLSSISLGYTLAVTASGIAVIAAFWVIWIKCIRNTADKSKRFVYLCCMLSVLAIPVGMLVAFDFIRWFQACIITQFGMVMLMFYKKDEAFEKTAVQLREFFGNKKLLLALIFIVYSTAQHIGQSA